MSLIDGVHGSYVAGRRVGVLARQLADWLPAGSRVLDVGCGDGRVAGELLRLRPDLSAEGVDVLVRPGAAIEVRPFNGRALPGTDGSVDVALLVDVLHHADDPVALLAEAARVSRRAVVVKDHRLSGLLAGPTLRFMDRVGNARHGVALPYHYLTADEWCRAFAETGLSVARRLDDLHLYPWPADLVFGRSLHFMAELTKTEPHTGGTS